MGKGFGSGEGWGQGEGNGDRGHHGRHKKTKNKWNHGVCSSCGNCSVCKFVNKSGLLFEINTASITILVPMTKNIFFLFSGCMTFWCPCVSMCLLADKAGLTGFQHKYLSFLDCFGTTMFFTWISACLTRERVRDKYNIPGDGCEDCLCTFCCLQCTICQMHNQVDGK